MELEAVKVAPNRHELQCRMWDCTRISPTFYCNFGHGLRSRTEEDNLRAVVYADTLSVDKETSLSLKIVTSKSQGQRCGVPTLPTYVLQGNPWDFPHVFDFNHMEDEAKRNWAFISETVLPSNIWVRYNTRTVLGMERISWRLRVPPAVGRYRLRRYRLPNYVNSLYWLSYEQNRVMNNGTGKTVSVPVPDTQKEGPPDPGAGAAAGPSYASTSGCNKTYMSAKGTEPQIRGFMDLSLNHYALSLLILSRAFMVSGRAEDAVRATLSSIDWDTVGITSLPSEESVSELRRKLGCIEGGELLRLVRKEMEFYNTMVERAAVRETDGDQAAEADEISYAIMEKMEFYNTMVERTAVRESDGYQAAEADEISYALMEKMEFYNTMVERTAVRESDGYQAAEADEISYALMEKMEFYNTMVERAAVRESDGEQAAEADEISYALMEKVEGLMQNLEKENS